METQLINGHFTKEIKRTDMFKLPISTLSALIMGWERIHTTLYGSLTCDDKHCYSVYLASLSAYYLKLSKLQFRDLWEYPISVTKFVDTYYTDDGVYWLLKIPKPENGTIKTLDKVSLIRSNGKTNTLLVHNIVKEGKEEYIVNLKLISTEY